MENQMKVCFVRMAQFQVIWNKLSPQQRFTSDLPTLCVMDKGVNTLFIVGKQEDFLTTPENSIRANWLVQILE